MHNPQRTSIPIPADVLDAAAETAEHTGVSRTKVLADWLQAGYRAVRTDALAAAYDDFYGTSDPDDVPSEVRRQRAARFDARWD